MSGSAEGREKRRILVVDDEEWNLLLLRRMLERAGHTQVLSTPDPSRVPRLFVESDPDLVVLDLDLPKMDGFELMERLAPVAGSRGVPFLALAHDATEKTKRRALESGASDFLTKPVSQADLLLRVHNLLEGQLLDGRMRERNLERQVSDGTRDLEHARLEMCVHLALAAEYRDDDTQEHAWRVGRTSGLLAIALGRPDSQVELIRGAAPLHDIGKIGIPDAILLKPGKLIDTELAEMQTHATIGAQILSGSESRLLSLAERIALTHHERCDGRGYPDRLGGEEIPLAGRIVAVADVFDALTHERPYKKAWAVKAAVAEILSQRGRQFDPEVVDAFATLDHPMLLGRVNAWQSGVSGYASLTPADRTPC